jgi:hypothetical protein
MKKRLFTMVWGKDHIELFKNACFRSMNWPKNKAAIKDDEWVVLTKKEHITDIHKIFLGSDLRVTVTEIGDYINLLGVGLLKTDSVENNFLLLRGLLQAIYLGVNEQTRMLFAPPDTIFGDGTVENLMKAGQERWSAVQVPHMRVNPSILPELDGPVSNPKLVTLSMKHIHKCWERSELTSPEQATFKTGVVWEKIGDNLYQVQHQLPTTYLVDFNDDDWRFWSGSISFGAYDHQWPGDNFIRQERQRFVGSSDACFIAEVTEADKNTGEVTPKQLLDQIGPFKYFNWRLHNVHNKQTWTYFRGE